VTSQSTAGGWPGEQRAPAYLYVGSDDYDEGGNRLLAVRAGPCPPSDGPVVVELHGSPAAAWIARLAGGRVGGGLTLRQVFWLANLPLVTLGHLARPIYELLVKAGYRAAIPIDNRLRILGPAAPRSSQEHATPPRADSRDPGGRDPLVMDQQRQPSTVTYLTAGAAGRRPP
jgi:hypothetical protein